MRVERRIPHFGADVVGAWSALAEVLRTSAYTDRPILGKENIRRLQRDLAGLLCSDVLGCSFTLHGFSIGCVLAPSILYPATHVHAAVASHSWAQAAIAACEHADVSYWAFFSHVVAVHKCRHTHQSPTCSSCPKFWLS